MLLSIKYLTQSNVRCIKLQKFNLFYTNTKETSVVKINLRDMKIEQTGVIASVRASGEMGRRIREMGLVPGKEVKVQGRAPLYDPVSLRIMGFTLTLRNNEADFIQVEVN